MKLDAIKHPVLVEEARYEVMAVLHNHPSGNPIPSKEDRKSQKKMSDAGNIIGINLLDFIIVGKDSYYSFKEERIM